MTTREFRNIDYEVKTATLNNQFLKGTHNPDWIEVLGGDNTVVTGRGNDVVLPGVDFLFIRNYELFGGEAIFYTPRSDGGNNVINVGAGDDYVVSGQGDDVVYLGEGNDIFDGSFSSKPGGNDTIYGGAGNDIIYAYSSGSKTVYAGVGNDNIKILDFSSSGDKHIVYAGKGDDIIDVSADGDDAVVYAGEGNDIIGVLVNDGIVYAGKGDDVIFVFNNDGIVDGGTGNDDILSLGKSVITGGAGDDLIGLNNIFVGGGSASGGLGDDTIFTSNNYKTLRGDNLICADAGNDTIISGFDNDTIYTGSGNNVINLRGGIVTLQGYLADNFAPELVIEGGGNDTVYLGRCKNTVIIGSSGFATIYGFSQNDLLDVNGLNASFTKDGNDTLISAGGSSLAILIGYTGSAGLV